MIRKISRDYAALFDREGPTELERRILGETEPRELRGRMKYYTKTIRAGDTLVVDVYPHLDREAERAARRALRQVTRECQERINLRNTRRRVAFLLDANFGPEDVSVTLTYGSAPDSYERAQKDVVNFLAAVKRRRMKRGLPALKYLYAIEEGERCGRLHIHLVMSGGIGRDEIERLWSRGYANCDRLQPNEYGLEALARYITKSERRRRRKWSCSRNLQEPKVTVSRTKLSGSRVRRLAAELDGDAKEILRAAYPGYEYVGIQVRRSDVIDGVYIEGRMRKIKTQALAQGDAAKGGGAS